MKTKGAKSFVWVKVSDLAKLDGDVDVKVSRVWVEKKAPDLPAITDDNYVAPTPCVITATTSENPEPTIQFTVSE